MLFANRLLIRVRSFSPTRPQTNYEYFYEIYSLAYLRPDHRTIAKISKTQRNQNRIGVVCGACCHPFINGYLWKNLLDKNPSLKMSTTKCSNNLNITTTCWERILFFLFFKFVCDRRFHYNGELWYREVWTRHDVGYYTRSHCSNVGHTDANASAAYHR